MKIKSKLQAIYGILKGTISYERNTISIDEIYEKVQALNVKYKGEKFCTVTVEIGMSTDKYKLYTPYAAHIQGSSLDKLFVELEEKLSGKIEVNPDDADKIVLEV